MMSDAQFVAGYFSLSQDSTPWVEYWHKTNVEEDRNYFTGFEQLVLQVLGSNYIYPPPDFGV